MSHLPSTMQALLLNAELKTASIFSIPLPTPSSGELLIKVHSIALNPIDSLYVSSPIGSTGRVVGSDFSGTVISSAPLPSDPSASSSSSSTPPPCLKPGTRVAGFLQGACSVNPRPGAFAEYVTCPTDLVWAVPEEMRMEEAATLSLCGMTAAQVVFYRLGLRAPFQWDSNPSPVEGVEESGEGKKEERWFFIYGASTSVGMYAAQLVRRSAEVSGRRIKLVGAASKGRFGMLKGEPYGYDELVDYRDEGWPEQVRKMTGGRGVEWAYDCISEGSTVGKVASTLHAGGSRKVAIMRSKTQEVWDAEGVPDWVEIVYGAVWEGLGEEIVYNQHIMPASREARTFAVAFYRWLSGGKRIEGNPVRLMPGGLERVVPDGFALLGTGTMEDRARDRKEEWMKPVSAEKMVYRLDF